MPLCLRINQSLLLLFSLLSRAKGLLGPTLFWVWEEEELHRGQRLPVLMFCFLLVDENYRTKMNLLMLMLVTSYLMDPSYESSTSEQNVYLNKQNYLLKALCWGV